MLQLKDLDSGAGLGKVEIQSDLWKESNYSDGRGKIVLPVPFGKSTSLLIKRDGYHFAMVGVGCEIGQNRAERLVTLTRK